MTLNTVAVQSLQFKRPNFVELNPILCPISAIETRAQILNLCSFYNFNFPLNLDLVTFDRLTDLGFFSRKLWVSKKTPSFRRTKNSPRSAVCPWNSLWCQQNQTQPCDKVRKKLEDFSQQPRLKGQCHEIVNPCFFLLFVF